MDNHFYEIRRNQIKGNKKVKKNGKNGKASNRKATDGLHEDNEKVMHMNDSLISQDSSEISFTEVKLD